MKTILMLFVALALSACTHDADFEPEGLPSSETGGKDTKPSGSGVSTSSSDWQVCVFDGTPQRLILNKQKVFLRLADSPYAEKYICEVVKITTQIQVSNPDDELIGKVTNDDRCGYIASTVATSSPVRGTEVIQDSNNPSAYHVTTTCYRVISSASGKHFSANHWLPCKPEEARLIYKYRYVS